MSLRTDTGPFAIVPEWLLDVGVSARAVVLYARLARFADSDGRAVPGRQLLAELLDCSRDSVDRAIAELVDVGAIEKRARRDDAGDPTSNEYLIRRSIPEGVAARLRPPSRTPAATGSRTGAALTRATLNESSDANASAHGGDLIRLPGGTDPDAELSSEVTEDGAQALVGGYVDALKAIGAPAPKRLVGQVARQVGELVKEGLTSDVIRKALELLVERRLNPASLPSLVPEAAAGPRRPPRVPRAAADAYRRDSHREDDAERHPPPEESLEDVERILGRPVAGVLRGVDT